MTKHVMDDRRGVYRAPKQQPVQACTGKCCVTA